MRFINIHVIVLLWFTSQLDLSMEQEGEHNDIPFNVIYRVPSRRCKKLARNWKELVNPIADGFDWNEGETDDGDVVSMYWKPGAWPYYNYLPSSDLETINGGLPQVGNLDAHLKQLGYSYKPPHKYIDDSSFQVISFQKWRPIWRQNTRWDRLIYQTASTMRLLKDPKRFNLSKITSAAALDFESSGINYFKSTLMKVKQLTGNSKGRIGFMGLPTCYLPRGDTNNSCSENSMYDNYRLLDIFTQSRVLYPTIFLPDPKEYRPFLEFSEERVEWSRHKVLEARRLIREMGEPKPWIVPIISYYYPRTKLFLLVEDMRNAITAPCLAGAEGVILWGASDMLRSREQCEAFARFYNYSIKFAVSVAHDCSKRFRGVQKFPKKTA